MPSFAPRGAVMLAQCLCDCQKVSFPPASSTCGLDLDNQHNSPSPTTDFCLTTSLLLPAHVIPPKVIGIPNFATVSTVYEVYRMSAHEEKENPQATEDFDLRLLQEASRAENPDETVEAHLEQVSYICSIYYKTDLKTNNILPTERAQPFRSFYCSICQPYIS